MKNSAATNHMSAERANVEEAPMAPTRRSLASSALSINDPQIIPDKIQATAHEEAKLKVVDRRTGSALMGANQPGKSGELRIVMRVRENEYANIRVTSVAMSCERDRHRDASGTKESQCAHYRTTPVCLGRLYLVRWHLTLVLVADTSNADFALELATRMPCRYMPGVVRVAGCIVGRSGGCSAFFQRIW